MLYNLDKRCIIEIDLNRQKINIATRYIFQGNYRFWNPNALALGGKTTLMNQTQALKHI